MHRLIEADDASASPSWERLDGIAETLTADEDQERRGEFCFLAKEQFWRTAWRARSLLSWTTTSSRNAGTGAITTRDCASWRGIARATACASKQQCSTTGPTSRRAARSRAMRQWMKRAHLAAAVGWWLMSTTSGAAAGRAARRRRELGGVDAEPLGDLLADAGRWCPEVAQQAGTDSLVEARDAEQYML